MKYSITGFSQWWSIYIYNSFQLKNFHWEGLKRTPKASRSSIAVKQLQANAKKNVNLFVLRQNSRKSIVERVLMIIIDPMLLAKALDVKQMEITNAQRREERANSQQEGRYSFGACHWWAQIQREAERE